MPGVPPGQNRIRLVLPFPKIQRTRESDTRSQSYRCLKFFLTVELWKFITNCTKTQINWNLCQFCVLFNALHAGKFSWFLKLFWYVNQRCKFGLRSTPSAVRAIFDSRYLTICFDMLTRGVIQLSSLRMLWFKGEIQIKLSLKRISNFCFEWA